MIRQVLRSLIVWLFRNRYLQPLRLSVSRRLHAFWATIAQSDLPFGTRYESGGVQWRELKASVDINPGSGDLFIAGRKVYAAEDFSALLPRGPLDLTCHMFARRIRREPALVLYAGQDVTASGFVSGLVSRFFALDDANLPRDILLLVNMEMGRTRLFQDALSDQLFQPRPIELMRRHRLVQVDELHEVEAPFLAPRQIAKARARVDKIYGPFTTGGPAIILCSDAKMRAPALIKACSSARLDLLGSDYIVLDADVTPLRILIHKLAAARVVFVPQGDEVSLLALLPVAQPPIVEFPLDRPESKLARLIRNVAPVE